VDLSGVRRRIEDMNRRAFLATGLAAAASPVDALAARAGGGVVALVTADLESHVVALDVESGRVVARLRTAPGPRSIESSPFGTAVVAHTGLGLVSFVETATLSVRAVLRGFGEPRYTAMHPTERLAYVTDSGRAEVVTIDLARAAIVRRTPVPGPARHVSVDPAGRSLWTALGTKAERVAVLDVREPRRPRLTRVFAPPFLAHDVVAAPDGTHVWVTSGSHDAIAVYRPLGGVPLVIRADAPPQHVAFAAGRAYLASGAAGSLQVRSVGGGLERSGRIPRGSYNVTYGTTRLRAAVVTPSLDRGTVCVLAPSGSVRLVRRVARSAHDACLAEG
jgi:DNA-binding beta-propeller fold protein YncE